MLLPALILLAYLFAVAFNVLDLLCMYRSPENFIHLLTICDSVGVRLGPTSVRAGFYPVTVDYLVPLRNLSASLFQAPCHAA